MTATDTSPPMDADQGQGRSDWRSDWRSDRGSDWRTGDSDGRRDSHSRFRDDAQGWLSRAQGWLDDRGRAAWIVAMILGFVIFWPIGLALLAYMIWSKRMFGKSCNRDGQNGHHLSRHHYRAAMRPSGNSAFDAYKADTLRRLEEEQSNFEAFLGRLREAKDKAEFDNFMEDRARAATSGSGGQDQGTPV